MSSITVPTHSSVNQDSAPDSSRMVQTFVLILLLAALVCVPWLERPFHTRGEPREALVAQAMIETGNWVSPPAYDGVVPSKPPFSHWLMALMSLPVGEVTEATSRLPSALAFIALVGAFFVFLARRTSIQEGTAATLILLTTSEWFRAASTCRVDTILATSMAAALLALFVWWERGFRGVPIVAIICTACATLTKGPVGFVLPLGIFSLFCWQRSGFQLRALPGVTLRSLLILVPVVIVSGTWYVLGYYERGSEFLQKVMYENFQRFSSTMADEPHKHSFVYLFAMLALGVLPWTLVVARLVCMQAFWQGRKLRDARRYWQGMPALNQYAWIAVVVIVIFFCIPSSKRSVYLLPAYPFIACLLQRVIGQYSAELYGVLRILSKVTYSVVLLLVAAGLVMLGSPLFGLELSAAALLKSFTPLKIGSLLFALFCLVLPLREGFRAIHRTATGRLAFSILAGIVATSCFVYDGIAWQLSPKQWVYSQEFRKAVNLDQYIRLYSFGSESYGASFYLHKPFSRVTPANAQEGMVVFLEAKRLDEFRRTVSPNFSELFRYHSGVEKSERDVVVIKLMRIPSV